MYRLRRKISMCGQLFSRVGTWLARKVFVATKFSVSPPTNLRKISLLTSASLVKTRSGASENQRVSATCQNVTYNIHNATGSGVTTNSGVPGQISLLIP